MTLNLPVICGSVRQNRGSIKPAKVLVEKLLATGHDSQVVDFLDLPLPFINSDPAPSKLNKQYPDANVQKWSAIAEAADGFIFVVPEYNHSYSPVLKNALDWLYPEYKNKAAGLVGVSNGPRGGVRAIEQLRPVLSVLSLYAVSIAPLVDVSKSFDEAGKLIDEKLSAQFDKLIVAVAELAAALKPLRR